MIHAAVLTISDSVTAGTRVDRSGPAVRDRLEQLGWQVSLMDVLPDERALISSRLAALADSGHMSAIFTTGGTGVALRDVTPEATRAVIDREIPGLGELMRARGLKATPLAVHWSRIDRTHSGGIGRALGPLSPPTIAQWMPRKLRSSSGPSNGSSLRNFTAARVRRRRSMRHL